MKYIIRFTNTGSFNPQEIQRDVIHAESEQAAREIVAGWYHVVSIDSAEEQANEAAQIADWLDEHGTQEAALDRDGAETGISQSIIW